MSPTHLPPGAQDARIFSREPIGHLGRADGEEAILEVLSSAWSHLHPAGSHFTCLSHARPYLSWPGVPSAHLGPGLANRVITRLQQPGPHTILDRRHLLGPQQRKWGDTRAFQICTPAPRTHTPCFQSPRDKADGLRPALPKALWLEKWTLTACVSVPAAELKIVAPRPCTGWRPPLSSGGLTAQAHRRCPTGKSTEVSSFRLPGSLRLELGHHHSAF